MWSTAPAAPPRRRAHPQRANRPRPVTVAWPAMPRSFDISADYEGNVESVLRQYSDEDYWMARLAASGVDEAKLESLRVGGESGNDGTIDVVTLQVIRSDKMPALLTQIHRGD